MKVYISSHSQDEARALARLLEAAGHEVAASWVGGPSTRTSDRSETERAECAARNLREVEEADALVLLASDDKVPGGKFVEAGAALILGKPVCVVGRRENMLLWHPGVFQVPEADHVVGWLMLHRKGTD
jgi:nucleoside 2-deoxyribosyltransferase